MSRVGKGKSALAVALAAGVLALTAGPAQGAEVMGPIGAQEWWLYGALDFSGAWPSSVGDNTTVAVLGDVVDSSNADLTGSLGQVLTFPPNLAVTDANVPGEDCFANEAASLIAGRGHATSGGSDGVIGLAAHAKVDPIAVGVDANHIAISAYLSQAIHVAVSDGVKIIDIVLPAANDSTVRDAIDYALANGAIVVAPSGNNTSAGNIMWTPAALNGVLAVAGITQAKLEWWPSSASGPKVSVAAPATGIMADGPGNKYETHNGTNCAAALTAGEAALIWSLHPTWTAGQVEQVILDTASGNGSRIDNRVGYGTINPTKAVAATAPAHNAAPLGAPPKLKPSVAPVAVPTGGNSPLWMVIIGVAAGLVVVLGAVFAIRWQRDRRGKLRHGYVFSEPAPMTTVGPSAYGDPAAVYPEYGPPAQPVDYSAWGTEVPPEYPSGGYPVQPADYAGEYPEQPQPDASGYTHWAIGVPGQPVHEQPIHEQPVHEQAVHGQPFQEQPLHEQPMPTAQGPVSAPAPHEAGTPQAEQPTEPDPSTHEEPPAANPS